MQSQTLFLFKINFCSKLSRTLSTDRKRASLLLQPCWIRTNKLQASVCRIVRVIVFPSLLVLWLDIKFSQILARGTGHSHQTVWQIDISSAQGSMGIPRLDGCSVKGTKCKFQAAGPILLKSYQQIHVGPERFTSLTSFSLLMHEQQQSAYYSFTHRMPENCPGCPHL